MTRDNPCRTAGFGNLRSDRYLLSRREGEHMTPKKKVEIEIVTFIVNALASDGWKPVSLDDRIHVVSLTDTPTTVGVVGAVFAADGAMRVNFMNPTGTVHHVSLLVGSGPGEVLQDYGLSLDTTPYDDFSHVMESIREWVDGLAQVSP